MNAFDLSLALQTIENMLRGAIALLPNLALATLLFVAVWFLAKAVGGAVRGIVARAHRPASLGLVLGRLAGWVVLAVGGMVCLTIVVPSLNASSVLGALGVGGVAIGFAFKDIFQNLLAGLLLLVTRPFQIGDQIVSGSHEGTVEDIQVRATLVRIADGRLVVVPNSDLYTNRVVVNTVQTQRRGVVQVGIGYGDDIARAKQVILAAVGRLPQVLRKPEPSVVAVGLGESSVDLSVRFWVAASAQGGDLGAATDAVLVATKQALSSAGIDIPFPIRTMVLPRQDTSDEHGDERLPANESDAVPVRGRTA